MFSLKKSWWILIAVVTASTLFIIASPPTANANEPTNAQTQECSTFALSNPSYRFADLGAADRDLVNRCRAYVQANGQPLCTSTPVPPDATRLNCANPNNTVPIQDASQAAAGQRVQPLIDNVCGTRPTSGSERTNQLYVDCANGVRAAYDACASSGGGPTSSITNPPEVIGPCVSENLGGQISPEDATAAVAAGAGAAQGTIDDAIAGEIQAANQEECEAQGGTWSAEENKCNAEEEPSCKVEHGISWIACPVLNFLAFVNDSAFGVLSDNFLKVPANLLDQNGKGAATYQAWQRFRDIANVIFVIGFLVVVYSQITSAGISNYGIKKMLPKIIVVAVLVNISYILCQLAVDLSNFLGYGLAQLFGRAMAVTPANSAEVAANPLLSGAGVTVTVIAGILAAGAVLYLMIAGSVLIPAVLALVMVVVILIARQALIVLLVVVAPVAFAAYLLPNTEKLFNSWWKMFYALLMVFPIVGMIYGASKLVSSILMPTEGAPGDDGYDLNMALIAIGASALPFLAVPAVLKGSLKATGAIGAKLESFTDRQAKHAAKGAKKRFKEGYDNSYVGRNRAIKQKERELRRTKIAGGTYQYSGLNPIKNIRKARSWAANKANNSWVSGTAGNTMSGQGAYAESKERSEAVDAMSARLREGNFTNDQLLDLAAGKSITDRTGRKISGSGQGGMAARVAARREIMRDGTAEDINSMLDTVKSGDADGNGALTATSAEGAAELNDLADTMMSSPNKPKYFQPADAQDMRHHGKTKTETDAVTGAVTTKTIAMKSSDGMIAKALEDDVYSPEAFATTGHDETDAVRKYIKKRQDAVGTFTGDEKDHVERYMKNASTALTDPRISPRLSTQRNRADATSKGDFNAL